jgi:heat shock protein HslJ
MASIALALPLTVLLPGLLAGCGDDTVDPGAPSSPTTPATTPTTPAPVSLDGRTFLSTGSAGFELVDGTVVRIEFRDDGTLSASAGCNLLGGAYRIDGDTLRIDGGLSMTEMGCEQALMDQDTRLADLLMAGPTVALDDDTLVLTAGDASITFLDREVADPDLPIEGTVWTLTAVIDGESASSIPMDATSTITFINGADAADGTVVVETGCNSGSATAAIGDGTITFGPLALTKMACEQPLMDLETSVLSVLAGDVTFEIEAGSLTITSSSGTAGLQYTALDD